MGQRSQIFVRYEYKENKNIKKGFVARYFQWDFRERMISRLRHTAEWLKENVRYLPDIRPEEDLVRILETNFDIGDIVHTSDIVDEVIEYDLDGKAHSPVFNDGLFFGNDNIDGIMFMDVDINGNIKYALLDPDMPGIIMTTMEYIAWDETYTFEKMSDGKMGVNLKGYGEWAASQFENDNKEAVVYTAANIGWINENITLMNEAEIKEFV